MDELVKMLDKIDAEITYWNCNTDTDTDMVFKNNECVKVAYIAEMIKPIDANQAISMPEEKSMNLSYNPLTKHFSLVKANFG